MAQSINNLAVGSKIKFGSLYGSPIIWKVVGKGHTGYPSGSITFLAERIIKLMCVDAKESGSADSNRRDYGNNRYIYSNIRQWLNSQAAAGAWYTAQHATDAPPTNANVWNNNNEYDAIAGFLNAFSANERNALLSTTLTVGKSSTDGGGTEQFADKVFLLSPTEVGLTGDFTEGTKLAAFSDNNSRIAYPTAAAVSNSEYTSGSLSSTQPWYYWLRSPYASSSYVVRLVNTDGTLSYNFAFSGYYGLRPAFNLSSDLLISDSADGDGCYTIIYNQAPTAPGTITVPTEVIGGETLSVSWAASTDPDGNLSGYKLERKVDAGSWTQVYAGSSRTYVDTITFGWGTVQYRVKAYDAAGAESAYTTSATRTVINNRAPEISGSDGALGTFAGSFTPFDYVVTDADGHQVTVTERMNGAILRTFTATLGSTNTISFTPQAWLQILNGNHTLTITATDAQGATVVRTKTFTKPMNQLSFALTNSLPADEMPTKCMVNVQGSFPAGSTLTVEVCNNGNDTSPTWENITTKVLTGQKHFFTNTTKTAGTWGFKVRATLLRGSATGPCYIQSIGGNFA
jgi:hypothetical protein